VIKLPSGVIIIDNDPFTRGLYAQIYRHAMEPDDNRLTRTAAGFYPYNGLSLDFITNNSFIDEKANRAVEQNLLLWGDTDWNREHVTPAEINLLRVAEEKKKILSSGYLIMPGLPLASSVDQVIAAKFIGVYCHEAMIEKLLGHKVEEAKEVASKLLDGGVKLFVYRGEIGGVKAMRRGEIWHP